MLSTFPVILLCRLNIALQYLHRWNTTKKNFSEPLVDVTRISYLVESKRRNNSKALQERAGLSVFSFIFRYLQPVMRRALRVGSCFYYYQQTTSGDFYNAKKDFYE
jgi:hypothetical protein